MNRTAVLRVDAGRVSGGAILPAYAASGFMSLFQHHFLTFVYAGDVYGFRGLFFALHGVKISLTESNN
jgi:hypothetical protein